MENKKILDDAIKAFELQSDYEFSQLLAEIQFKFIGKAKIKKMMMPELYKTFAKSIINYVIPEPIRSYIEPIEAEEVLADYIEKRLCLIATKKD